MGGVKHGRRALGAGCAVLAIGLGTASSASAAPAYPDLRTLPPSDLHLSTIPVGAETHHAVLFTNQVANAGEGPLELHGYPHFPDDGRFDAKQWIYDLPTGVQEETVGEFEYHAGHGHFHLGEFARYELWTAREFERAAARGFARGAPLGVAPKVTFCVRDDRPVDPAAPPTGAYRTCTALLEGLSVGWLDSYDWLLTDQWVDVGTAPLPDGEYVLRSVADPVNRIFESPGKADPSREGEVTNSAVTYFTVTNGQLSPAP